MTLINHVSMRLCFKSLVSRTGVLYTSQSSVVFETLQVIWHDVSRSQWQEYALETGEILHIFPSGTQSMADRRSKKAYLGLRTGIYLPTKFGCDRSIVVGCRSRNDRQTDKQNGMTIRLSLRRKSDGIYSMTEDTISGVHISQVVQRH